MINAIELSSQIEADLIAHARQDLPNECCGYITGVGHVCKTLYKMTNVDASPEYFEFDPKEQFQVIKTARKQGETPLVVYHSHPETPARLSQKDLALLTDPNMVYIIISLNEDIPVIKAFRIHNQQVSDVMIDIKEEKHVI